MKISRIIAAVMALVVAPLLMVSPVSMAAIPGGIAPMQGPCQSAAAEIRIVHYEKTPSDDDAVGDGEENTKVTGTPIPGATFRLRGIVSVGGEEVPDQEGIAADQDAKAKLSELFAKLQNKTGGEIEYDEDMDDDEYTVDTDDQGEATFEELQYGLYEVEEIKAPSGYSTAGTFYVMIPRAGVDVAGCPPQELFFYPKSEKDPTLEKTVKDDTATSIGSPISYTLKGSVSSAKPGKYEISDQLSQKIKLKSVTVKIGDQALVAADYILGGELNKAGQAVVVTLTDAGLAKLKTAYEASPDVKVSVDVNGEIAAIPGADNDRVAVSNKAYLIPSDSDKWKKPLDGEHVPGVPSNEVATKFGGIKIHKVDYLKESKSLAGAKFKVYASKADADSQANELKFLDKDGNEVTEVATGDDGLAVIEGLRVSNFINGKATDDSDAETNNDSVKYWVVETVAPAGYSVLPEPIEVTVTSTVDANNAGLVALTDKQIEDVAVNSGYRIPNTGLYGPFGYVLAGVILLLIGGAAVFISRRNR